MPQLTPSPRETSSKSLPSRYEGILTYAEDASTLHAGTAPRAMATFRNLVIGLIKTFGAVNIAKTTRAIRDQPERALPLLSITNNPGSRGT
ncbi:hypothetical protein [Streptomyces sp. NBC_01217]|uniref:hypothetical protein n=1 Tax=Streptomyces sp. NBC_01217 TaxID=2903779 RepID=UPI002E150BA6|nr:hypothetical protein OG507_34015 [Streptomyces sp. NBC_01217]